MGVLNRVWKAVKPPPAVYAEGAARKKFTRKQKRLLGVAATIVIAGGVGCGVYIFSSGSEQRAEKEFRTAMRMTGPGLYLEAVTHFSRAIEYSPGMTEAYLERGIAYAHLNENDVATRDFTEALELDPNLAEAYAARGAIYRQRGEFARALEDLTKSLDLQPTQDAYYERGETYEALNEHQKAIADYDSAIAAMRDAPNVYRSRALAKRNLGDLAGYEADRDQAAILERRR
jgi:tetratricopeptide (TPR) repeat protein